MNRSAPRSLSRHRRSPESRLVRRGIMRMWRRDVPAALAIAAFVGAPPSAAQAPAMGVVDEASFTMTRGGVPYGTESFRIVRRLGAEGVEYAAQCTRTLE